MSDLAFAANVCSRGRLCGVNPCVARLCGSLWPWWLVAVSVPQCPCACGVRGLSIYREAERMIISRKQKAFPCAPSTTGAGYAASGA